MFRFISYISMLLFSATLSATQPAYVKQGAPIALAVGNYTLKNTTAAQTLTLQLQAGAAGTLALRYSGDNGAEILNAPSNSITVESNNTLIDIPLTVTTPVNSKSYLNIFVTFTHHNGRISSRALSAILNNGTISNANKINEAPAMIHMQAVETISYNE